MPKRDQQHPAKGVTGHNNPKKTTEHTREHSELAVTHKANSREREEDREHRSGSDSNAHKHRKDSQVHEHEKKIELTKTLPMISAKIWSLTTWQARIMAHEIH